MSLAFRVYGLPRSGTTWVANWLSHGSQSLCWHDPCEWARPADIEKWASHLSALGGVSCTGTWFFHPDWHPPIPTICLTKDRYNVIDSLKRLRLPIPTGKFFDAFDELPFQRYSLADLMDPAVARFVWQTLIPSIEFDPLRHSHLAKMYVSPSGDELVRLRKILGHLP